MVKLQLVNGDVRAEIHVGDVDRLDAETKATVITFGPTAQWMRTYCYEFGNLKCIPEAISWHTAEGFLIESCLLP